MEPNRLKMLVALGDTGSLSKAARRLGVSRSTATRMLDELSEEVGLPLADVQQRGATLTPEGRHLAERAPQLIQRAESLIADFSEPAASPGQFSFAVPVGLPPPITARIALLASKLLGRSRFSVMIDPDPLSRINETADVALVYGPQVPDGPWKTTRLLRLDEGLGATPSYLARRGTPETIDDLENHRLLLWERLGFDPRQLPLADGSTRTVDPWVTSNDPWVIRRAAEDGIGIGAVQRGPLPKRRESAEELVPVLPELVHRACTLQMVFSEHAVPRLRVRTLADLGRAVLRGL